MWFWLDTRGGFAVHSPPASKYCSVCTNSTDQDFQRTIILNKKVRVALSGLHSAGRRFWKDR